MITNMLFALLAIVNEATAKITFTAYGDWGWEGQQFSELVSGLKDHHQTEQADFTVLLGDNFYHGGVYSITDRKFEMFSAIRDTAKEFYVIAGNDDWVGNVQAQIDYSRIEKNGNFQVCIMPFTSS